METMQKAIFLLSILIVFKSNIMKAQVINGSLWKIKNVDNTYIFSINNKAGLLDTITDFVTVNKIPAGSIISLAAINVATIHLF